MIKVLYPAEIVGKEDSYSIVDMRDHQTFLQGTVEGAINVPMDPDTGRYGEDGYMTQSEAVAALLALPKNKTVAVMCADGDLSKFMTEFLLVEGYDARYVHDGIAGYEAERAKLEGVEQADAADDADAADEQEAAGE